MRSISSEIERVTKDFQQPEVQLGHEIQRWCQGRNARGGKHYQSADSERSKQNFYGPHLSDLLKS